MRGHVALRSPHGKGCGLRPAGLGHALGGVGAMLTPLRTLSGHLVELVVGVQWGFEVHKGRQVIGCM